MIVTNFPTFRRVFKKIGGAADIHGWDEFDPAQMRAGGFTGLVVEDDTPGSSARPFHGWPIYCTVNGYATDTVVKVDEYDWYVSQKTDDVDKQLISVNRHDVIDGYQYPPIDGSRSGTIRLALSPLGAQDYNQMSYEDQLAVFKHVYVYVHRISDHAIQMVDLNRFLFSGS
jgi:hypothetical protein